MFPILLSSKAVAAVFEESTSVGDLWTWGEGSFAGGSQLMHDNTTDLSSPVQVGTLFDWETFHGSQNCVYMLKSNGTIWSAGDGAIGGLGTGSTADTQSPNQIGALTTWRKITGGQQACKAVKSDGKLWVWGYTAQGQLGLGNATQYSSPVQVGALTTWGQLVNSPTNTGGCMTTSNVLFMWGKNSQGTAGVGTTADFCSPVAVAGGGVWAHVASGQVIV